MRTRTKAEETGKLFSNLVGFGSFISIKDKLDKISRTQNINNDFGKPLKENSIRNNNQKITELKTEIQKRLKDINIEIEPYNQNEIFNALRLFLKKQYGIKTTRFVDDTQIDFDKLVRTKIGVAYEENVLRLNNLQDNLNEALSLKKGINGFNRKSINGLKNKLKEAYKEIETNSDVILGRLFDDALTSYETINDFDKNTCILCNTHELGTPQNTFYQQIEEKIKSYLRFKNKYALFFNEYVQNISSNKVIEIEKEYIADNERFFGDIEKRKDYVEDDFFEANNIVDIITIYKETVKNKEREISASIKQIKDVIPPKVSELIETNNVYKFVFNSIVEIQKLLQENNYNEKFLTELEKWTLFIYKVKEDYEEAYNILMDEIASMIDSDTKLFFKEIMGNVDITPKLKKEYKGQKVNILLEKFYSNTNELKAVPLLSESYRNALSLSIYFATALKSKNPGNFIIVDDITSSFDSGHQVFLLELIKKSISISPSNKKGKQIIFLTHDGLLKKQLNENGNLVKNWQHYTLNSNKEIASLKSITSNDLKNNLVKKINANEYEGSGLRLYYESVLLEIIEKLNLEVPFSLVNSHDEKMVNKLVSAISEIVELKLRAKRIKNSLVPSRSDFKTYIQQFGNNLSHWASASQVSVSQVVLIRIVDDIDNFKQKFQYNCSCSKNAGWIYYKGLVKNPIQKGCTCIL